MTQKYFSNQKKVLYLQKFKFNYIIKYVGSKR